MMSWCRQARVAGVLALLLLSAIALADDQGHNKRTKADKDEIENEESETPMGAPVDEEEQLRADGVLAQQLKLAVQAQKERKLNKTEAMKLLLTSRIVPEAGNASLWAGIGDVPTTGSCQAELGLFCPQVEPGQGRLAACISRQLEREASGDAGGEAPVSDPCRAELVEFKMDRASNVNKDLALAMACRRDIRRYCRPKLDGADPAAILDCLREKRQKLSGQCAQQVLGEEVEEAKDWRVNPQLHKACAADAESLCAHLDGEEGAVTECLIENRVKASPGCRGQLARWEAQRAGDVRLDRRLYRACWREARAYCGDVEPGEGRLEACLQDQRLQGGFGQRCRRALEARMERQSADIRLNWGLRQYCADDIAVLCADQAAELAQAEGYGGDGQVIACLEEQRERISGRRCADEVRRQLAHEAEDVRFDHRLSKACRSDVQSLCDGVLPGSARVAQCLREQRAQLSEQCAQSLLQHELKLADDIDFKFPLRRACVVEMDIFCRNVPHGHSRVVVCLRAHHNHPEMSTECAQELRRDEWASSLDFRLNHRLRKACAADIPAACGEVAAACPAKRQCQGRVLDCLRDKQDQLRSEECRHEVFETLRAEVFDMRGSPQSVKLCAKDAQELCGGVKPGEGRLHACLQRNLERLSPQCRERELRLAILQARDVRLQPQVVAACESEMVNFCEGVEAGQGRMLRCLTDHVGQPGFGAACRRQLGERQLAAQADYRLDYGLAAACPADVAALCGEMPPPMVVGCLVDKYQLLAEPCQAEFNRFARQALWSYRRASGMTAVCDADVQARCPAASKRRGALPAGLVGRCLAKQVAQGQALSPACRALVLAAVPRDARAMFDGAMSLDAVVAKVAKIAHSAGLSATFVDQSARGMQAITVTGWVAVACVAAMVAVVAGMALFAVYSWARARATAMRRWPAATSKAMSEPGGAASITCVGNVPKQVNGNQTWAAALAGLANATSANVELRDVRFSAVTFSRFLDVALGAGAGPATTSVDVLLTNCSMKGTQGDYAQLAALAGTKSYSVQAKGCEFVGNSLNVTTTLAAQGDLALSVQLTDTVVNANKLVALGLVGVGAAGQASLSLAGSEVVGNDASLVGALAVGGGAALAVQLASTNLTGNSLLQLGLVAAGGEASAEVTGLNDSSVVVQGNNLDSRVAVAAKQPLVAAVLDVVSGLAFNETGFDLPSALDEVQRQLCATLAAANWTVASAEQRSALRPLADQLGALLCPGAGAGPAANLSSLAGTVEGWAGEGLGALASVLEGVLGDPKLVQGLVSALQGDTPLGPALNDLLASLLANTDVQNGLGFLGGLVSQLGEWLGQPIGGGGDGTALPSGLDLGGAIADIISQIGGGEGGAGGAAGVGGALQGIINSIVGAIGGNGTVQGSTPGDIINSVVGAIAGPDSPLAGQNVTSLVPVLGAVLQDPQALASLPGLLGGLLGGNQSGGGGGGGLDLGALGPILGSINKDPQAASALPDVLGLLGQLLGGNGGGLLGK